MGYGGRGAALATVPVGTESFGFAGVEAVMGPTVVAAGFRVATLVLSAFGSRKMRE